MNEASVISLIVEDHEGMRLDRWLRKHYPYLNQAALEKLLRLGRLRLDGRKVAASERVSKGQTVTIPPDLASLSDLRAPLPSKMTETISQEDAAFIESMVIWEDDDILVLNKPSGLATQGGNKTARHVDGLLSSYGNWTKTRYRLVHRLDRDTSGLLVVAKTAEVATFLTAAFRLGEIKKTYWAIVMGQPVPGEGTINAPLLKGGRAGNEKVFVDQAGKPAITRYRTITGLKKRGVTEFAWLELFPETGRTHQLRVHMALYRPPCCRGRESMGDRRPLPPAKKPAPSCARPSCS